MTSLEIHPPHPSPIPLTLFCSRKLECTSMLLALSVPTSSSSCSVSTCCVSFSRFNFSCASLSIPPLPPSPSLLPAAAGPFRLLGGGGGTDAG